MKINLLKSFIIFFSIFIFFSNISAKADTYSSTDPDNYITITTNLNKSKYSQNEDMFMSLLITLSNYYSYDYVGDWTHIFDIKFYNMLEENLSYSPPTLSTNNSFNTSQKGVVIYDDATYFVGKANSGRMVYTDINYTGRYQADNSCYGAGDSLHLVCGSGTISKFYSRLGNPYSVDIALIPEPLNTPPEIFVR